MTPLWKQALLQENSTISDAIENLEYTGLRICILVDNSGRLAGVVTDGDIRRAMLKNSALYDPVATIMSQNPLTVKSGDSRNAVVKVLQDNKVLQVPVINDKGVVVGLHMLDEMVSPGNYKNTIVIMAGGFGKRLKPLTDNCPKPMVKIGNKPILQHIIERAINDGFSSFLISVCYLKEQIMEYFKDGSWLGVSIEYLEEQDPLGTAGALSMLCFEQFSEPLVVVNGDVITEIKYSELIGFHQLQKADATMAIRHHEVQNQFGIVKLDGVNIIGFEEKPVYTSYINAGMYVVEPKVLSMLERNISCDMPTLFERASGAGLKTVAYPMYEDWFDVGRHDDLQLAQNHIEKSLL